MEDAEETFLVNIFLRQQLQQFYDENASGVIPDISNLNQAPSDAYTSIRNIFIDTHTTRQEHFAAALVDYMCAKHEVDNNDESRME